MAVPGSPEGSRTYRPATFPFNNCCIAGKGRKVNLESVLSNLMTIDEEVFMGRRAVNPGTFTVSVEAGTESLMPGIIRGPPLHPYKVLCRHSDSRHVKEIRTGKSINNI
jgi:hypothetical protein